MSKVLDELEWQVEASGYVPGTEEFARRLRAAKVEKCKELQRVDHCSNCRAFLDCKLVKTHLKDYTVGRSSHGQSAG
jgi:hypothetical protein